MAKEEQSKEEVHKLTTDQRRELRKSRVQQLVSATLRSRLAFGVLVFFSGAMLLTNLFADYSWNTKATQFLENDLQDGLVQGNFCDNQPGKRIVLTLGVDSSDETAVLSQDVQEKCRQELAASYLGRTQRRLDSGVTIPLVDVHLSIADFGTFGGIVLMLLLWHFYAASRRELSILSKFIRVLPVSDHSRALIKKQGAMTQKVSFPNLPRMPRVWMGTILRVVLVGASVVCFSFTEGTFKQLSERYEWLGSSSHAWFGYGGAVVLLLVAAFTYWWEECNPERKRKFFLQPSERCWGPIEYYLAHESVAHRFVYLSATKDRVLKVTSNVLIWAPVFVYLYNVSTDVDLVFMHVVNPDSYPWEDAVPMILVGLLLFVSNWCLAYRVWRIQSHIRLVLSVWANVNDECCEPVAYSGSSEYRKKWEDFTSERAGKMSMVQVVDGGVHLVADDIGGDG